MITLRLEKKLNQDLDRAVKARGVTKSEFIRTAIQTVLCDQRHNPAWESGKELFGRHASGHGRLASDSEKIVRARMRKHADHDQDRR